MIDNLGLGLATPASGRRSAHFASDLGDAGDVRRHFVPLLATLALCVLAGCKADTVTQPSSEGPVPSVAGSAAPSATPPGTSSPAPRESLAFRFHDFQSGSTPYRGGGPLPAPAPHAPAPTYSPLAVGTTAYVTVTWATVWTEPSSVRQVDLPAISAPVRPTEWLGIMTLDERRALNGRTQTQALYGDQVQVVGGDASWTQIRVLDQPSPDKGGGYPGWIPRRQLTSTGPQHSDQVATVTAAHAPMRDTGTGELRLTASFGTELPVLRVSADTVTVSGTDGRAFNLPASQVSVTRTGAPALRPSGADLVRTARLFSGVDYLWAGTSADGFDCSGLTYLVYRTHGITIPRDAGPQSKAGRAVARADLQPGDLVFFANSGGVHHVGMYVGNGRMINALQTGSTVNETSIEVAPWTTEYAGARRYL